jgi:small-conductance mechanosensitive channel
MEIIDNQLSFDMSAFLDPALYASYAIAIFAFLITYTGLKIVKSSIVKRLRKLALKTTNQLDDTIVDILESLNFVFYFPISLYVAIQFIELPQIAEIGLYYIFVISIIYVVAGAIQRLIDIFTEELIKQRKKEEGEDEDVSLLLLGNQILKYAVWVFAILMLLSNFGIEIGPILAGASIGAVAIAFALQNVLTDVFASFAIYFDKPFKVGDFITIGTDSGTVKKIGIKTTRIQALQGEELVISNTQLLNSRINNFKKMDTRRIVFGFRVIYQTPVEKLEKIPKIVTKIIELNPDAQPDRVHFKKLADSSLDYEVVYYVKSNDFRKYMDTQEKINLEIMRQFAKEGIDFAYPTRTIYMEK